MLSEENQISGEHTEYDFLYGKLKNPAKSLFRNTTIYSTVTTICKGMKRTKFRKVVFAVTTVGEGRDGLLEGHPGV